MVKLGAVAIDGTKIRAQASLQQSMRYPRLREEEQRLQGLVDQLLAQAAATDAAEDATWGKGQPADPLPPELAQAEQRLQKLRQAKAELEQEARQQCEAAVAEHPPQKTGRPRKDSAAPKLSKQQRERLKVMRRRAKQAMAGKTRHYNLTDPDSRVMRDNGLKAIVQSYNAQLVVDGHRQIILAAEVTQEANDKQQLAPMIKADSKAIAEEPVAAWLADAGYWSESQLTDEALAEKNVLVSPDAEGGGKDKLTENNSLAERMRKNLESAAERSLYALRRVIVEPVFGRIKEQRRFRRFSCKGLSKAQAEWKLVCMTHNLLKLFQHQQLADSTC